MHKMGNNSLGKEEISDGDGTWYMGRTFQELKIYTFICLIPICIDNKGTK